MHLSLEAYGELMQSSPDSGEDQAHYSLCQSTPEQVELLNFHPRSKKKKGLIFKGRHFFKKLGSSKND